MVPVVFFICGPKEVGCHMIITLRIGRNTLAVFLFKGVRCNHTSGSKGVPHSKFCACNPNSQFPIDVCMAWWVRCLLSCCMTWTLYGYRCRSKCKIRYNVPEGGLRILDYQKIATYRSSATVSVAIFDHQNDDPKALQYL